MLEEYFIKQMNFLKEENERLKEENQRKDNQFLVLEERPQIKLELIANEPLFKRLEEKGIELKKIVEEYGSREIQELIKDLVLYKEIKNDNYFAIVKINNKYYGLEKYYDEYKFKSQVYVDFDEAVYNDLVDKLYDKVQNEINRRKQEQK